MPTAARRDRRARRGASHCFFYRGERQFAVPASATGQILSGRVARPLARPVPFIVGLVDLNEGLTPLVQFDSWLGLTPRPYRTSDHVVSVLGAGYRIALVVDRVRDVQLIDEVEIFDPASRGVNNPMVRAVAERDGKEVWVLDPEKLVGTALEARERVPEWGPAAREELAPRRTEGSEEYCIFTRGARELALPISAAREMLGGDESLTRVPQSPPHLIGVLNLRGDLLPVVCIDSWLGLPERSLALSDQIVVIDRGVATLGIVVDRVRDVRTLQNRDIRPDAAQGPIFRGTWEGVEERIAILDAERLVERAVELAADGFRRAYGGSGSVGGSVAQARS